MKHASTSTDFRSRKVKVGNGAKDLVSFGRSQGWDFPVLGNAPIPTRTVHINGWLIAPAHLDSTDLPPRAKQRMDTILAAGIRPKAWLIIHEAPKLLPANISEETKADAPISELISPKSREHFKSVLKVSGSVLGAIALATGALALAVVAAALILPGFLIAGALLLDPILVAVTEDGFWVEIDRWDD